MTSLSRDEKLAVVSPPRLSTDEVRRLLDLRLIASLATIDDDGGIHVVPIWYRRDGNHILMPTSRLTHKYHNLARRPRASVMIDVSRSGLNLKGVLIRGAVEIIDGDQARELNRSIHLRYVTEEGLELPDVIPYLVEGDDVTLKVDMERVVTWDNAAMQAATSLESAQAVHPLDT